MAYEFMDTEPRNEVMAREGYYRDWSHIDANVFHQIMELVTFIREKGHGIDTREAISQAFERIYHDMAIEGNANMEVSAARGSFETLVLRLANMDGRISNTMSQAEFDSWVATLLDGGPSIFMDSLAMLQSTYPTGASGVALVRETNPAKIYVWDGQWRDFGEYQGLEVKDRTVTTSKLESESVTADKTNFIKTSTNLFNINKSKRGKNLDENGAEIDTPIINNTGYTLSDFIDVIPNDSIYAKEFSRLSWFTKNNIFLYHTSSTPDGRTHIVPPNAYRVRGNIHATRNVELAQFNISSTAIPFEPFIQELNSDTRVPSKNIIDLPYEHAIIVSRTGYLNVDTINHQLKVESLNSGVQLLARGKSISLAHGATFSYEHLSTANGVVIYYDMEEKRIEFAQQNAITMQLPTSSFFLGIIFNVPQTRAYMQGDYRVDHISPSEAIKKDLIANELADLTEINQLSSNLENSITSWWTYPLAKDYKGFRDKTYIGWTDNQGYSGVASIDNVSGQIIKKRLKQAEVDDHNAVAVEVMPDGRIITAYATGHNTDDFMRIRISRYPESVESFEDEILIESVNGRTSYAQIFYSNNKWFLFYRANARYWEYTTSSDGENWALPTVIVDGGEQYYLSVKETTDSDRLRLIMYSHPDLSDPNFRQAFLNTLTLNVETEDGTTLGGTVSSNEVPIVVYRIAGKKQRLLDVSISDVDEMSLVYIVYPEDGGGIYKMATVLDGDLIVTDLKSSGSPFMGSSYFNGAIFGYDKTSLYISSDVDGIDYIEEWSNQNGVWEFKSVIKESQPGNIAVRPFVAKGGSKVFWQEGYYNTTNFTDFLTDLKYYSVD